METIRLTIRRWVALILVVFTLIGCEKVRVISIPSEVDASPTGPFADNGKPSVTDDLDQGSLLSALDKSMRYWQKQEDGRVVELCGNRFSPGHILDSLLLFRTVISESAPGELSQKLMENFNICTANDSKDILVTGYYQPVLQASLEKKKPFLYPLYSVPSDLIKTETRGNGKNQVQTGRSVQGKLEPYWSRGEIETGQLLKGYEIAYLDDPVKAFFLHVQGSGLLELQDGSIRSILFAGSNGREYKSIGKLLADEGRVPLKEISMPRISEYLHEHLDEQQRILHYNERYIFFSLGEEVGNHEVVGSMGAELTAGRSVALDKEHFPYGIPALLQTRRPIFAGKDFSGWRPLSRFVFNQDSGAAIKGAGRLDLFFGRGPEAEGAAGIMKEQGRLYFFVKKQKM